MMNRRVMLASTAAFVGLTACSKFKTYNGPEVTEIFVFKENRKMYLMHHQTALAEYDVHLGFSPYGHKQQKGDGRTPEGSYRINRRNPDSAFHLSVGLDYPNDTDRKIAKEVGVSPGGDIFIHGGPTRKEDKNKADWTAGCIAVTNKKIEDIYAMVRDGTPIHIFPAKQPPLLRPRPGTPKPFDETAPDILVAHGREPIMPMDPVLWQAQAGTEVLVTSNGTE